MLKKICCTNCNSELKKFEESNLRKNNKNEKFIICKKCNNVMIGTYTKITGKLKSVIPTPNDSTGKAKDLIDEAKSLFSFKVKVSLNGKDVHNETKETEKNDIPLEDLKEIKELMLQLQEDMKKLGDKINKLIDNRGIKK